MNSTNSIGEWQQLRDRYATLTDEELQAIADDAYDLTDSAKQALREELLRRGLPAKLATPEPPPEAEGVAPGGFDPAGLDLLVARRVGDREEARKVMQLLHDTGVPCYLGPENVERVDDFQGSFDKGVDIKVLRAQIDGVNALLARVMSDPGDGAELPEAAVRCPKCHSDEIVFQSLDEQVPDGSTANSKFNWSCDSCGYQWKDDGVEEEA
jgi:DNA-directed RNA polymerase subunit M/transcription elongation factor TFIIS